MQPVPPRRATVGWESPQSGNTPFLGAFASLLRLTLGFFSGPPMTRTSIPFRSASAARAARTGRKRSDR